MWLRLLSKKDDTTVIRVNTNAIENFAPNKDGGTNLFMIGESAGHFEVHESVEDIESAMSMYGEYFLLGGK